MGYLIDQYIWWLLLTALAAGVAGWAFHRLRTADEIERLERQRIQLRKDLVALVNGEEGAGFLDLERESDLLRTRIDVADARIAELETLLEDARRARDEAHLSQPRVLVADALISDEREELDALRRLAADAQAQRDAEIEIVATPAQDLEPMRWRMRYLESRVRYLEEREAVTAQPAPIAVVESAPVEPHAHAWRIRYLEAQLRHHERAALASTMPGTQLPTPGDDDEAAQRQAWRLRYLEKRLGYVEAAAADHGESAARRIAALETELDEARVRAAALIAERDAYAAEAGRLEPDAQKARRLGWRARYLDARVRHLEAIAQRPAASPAPATAMSAPSSRDEDEVEEAPAPLVATGQEVRPQGLAAPRGGAPDDLTLIDGVSPQKQSTLNSIGVYHFDQIAAWSPGNVAWVDQYLRLRGRIVRERWVEQAGARARGEGLVGRRYLQVEEV